MYKDIQIPDGFKFPYKPMSAEEQAEWDEKEKQREKELEEAFNKFVKSQSVKDTEETPGSGEVDDDDGDAILDPSDPEFTDFNNGPEWRS